MTRWVYERTQRTARFDTGERDVYTPSRLNREVRQLLERGFPGLKVEGEISNLSRPGSGHWYFSLKDESAQLRCAMFRQRNLLLRFAPRDGMHVLARGRLSLYEPRGDYQLIVDYLEEAGEGALRRRFEELKAKLAAEGLFAQEHKRLPPELPRCIGIVTSPTGAAIRDILHVLGRRFPAVPVRIYPVPVQGQGAAIEIAAMIEHAGRRRDCDVLILSRGGGSLEDLWCFNEEIVARAIFACEIPIVAGIGHEIDFTIADFVADVRAPTPSAAAEVVVPDCGEWARGFAVTTRRLASALQRGFARGRHALEWAERRLNQLHPGITLRNRAQQLDDLERRLAHTIGRQIERRRSRLSVEAAHLARHSPSSRLGALRSRHDALALRLEGRMRRRLETESARFATVARTLHAVSPLATLDRGYAIVNDAEGHVVTRATDLQPGISVTARLAHGRFRARVEHIDADAPTSPNPDGKQ